MNPAKRLVGSLYERFRRHRADTTVVSYPKSGRTWLRLLLGRVLVTQYGLEEAAAADPDLMLRVYKLSERNDEIPSVYFSHDDKPHAKPTAEIERDKRAFYEGGTVFLYRDPRDVAVSQYFSLTKRSEEGYKGSISDFVRDWDFGPRNHIEYLNVWAEQRGFMERVRFVSYEELQADTESVVESLLDFIGVESTSPGIVRSAVEFSSFDNMRKMESGGVFSSGMLTPKDQQDKATYKTRRGVVGGYVDYLNAEDLAYLEQLIRETLHKSYESYHYATSESEG